jgi:hypothetical protein
MLARVADLPTACSPIETGERAPQDQEHWQFASELRNRPLASVTPVERTYYASNARADCLPSSRLPAGQPGQTSNLH